MTRAMHLWRWACGLDGEPAEGEPADDFESRKLSEWSYEFERLMRNGLLVGSYRYGKIGARGKPRYDRCSAIVRRIHDYEQTGNVDRLRDVANLAMLEFVEGRHPTRHMAAEAHGETVEVIE